jgi:RNA polymerase sigma factor (sigma-70 family)
MMRADEQLLSEFVQSRSEAAFAELVHRHLNLVYSAALRQVRSQPLAEEIAQMVFVDLSRNAHRLAPDTVLTAWLYQVTRRTAIDVIRSETRRALREQIATEMNAINDGAPSSSGARDSTWAELEPLLDDAMDALDQTDRAALLLRFFENKSLREVGEALGSSEDAAQKRVSRALDRLRDFFARRGVTVGASGLGMLISSNAVQTAPAALAATISTAATLTATALQTTATAIAATETIAMTALQKTLIGATLVAAVGTAIFEAHQVSRMRDQVQTLERQHASGIERLLRERDDAAARSSALQQENELLRQTVADVPRMRGELARLRADAEAFGRRAGAGGESGDPLEMAARSWLSRVTLLKERAQQKPELTIPEFQFLTEEDWLSAARKATGGDLEDRKVLSDLRRAAEQKFISRLQPALRQYMEANHSEFPADISQLAPYFDPPLDDLVLQRWKIAPAEEVPNVIMGGKWIVTQQGPVDEEHDRRFVVGPNGWGGTNFQSAEQAGIEMAAKLLKPAVQAFQAANPGVEPENLSLLLPHVTTPEQSAALRKLLEHQQRADQLQRSAETRISNAP